MTDPKQLVQKPWNYCDTPGDDIKEIKLKPIPKWKDMFGSMKNINLERFKEQHEEDLRCVFFLELNFNLHKTLKIS